jgi:prepilin-type N-terminal cleavage/methylation domain-containing protein
MKSASRFKKLNKGFTLIELLMVIAIIGLLASIALIALGTARTRARTAKANADLQHLITSIEFKRDELNTTLQGITGSYYTAGGSGGPGAVCLSVNLQGISDSSSCGSWLNTQFQKLGFARAPRDPWSAPYLMDENELENGNCNKDTIRSNGPDGIFSTSDDISTQVPFFKC